VSVPGRGIASYDVADEPEQCVPYARRISGITLYGDAWTWWDQAIEVDLDRGEEPRRGAVLVLDRTSRLSHGHLAVVVTVVDDREIVVSQSN
jgi:surface antigen